MADDEQQDLERKVRELEDYLEGLAHHGRIGHTSESGRRPDTTDAEIARARRELDALKKRLATAR